MSSRNLIHSFIHPIKNDGSLPSTLLSPEKGVVNRQARTHILVGEAIDK